MNDYYAAGKRIRKIIQRQKHEERQEIVGAICLFTLLCSVCVVYLMF